MQLARLMNNPPVPHFNCRSASLVIALAMLGVLAMQPLSAVLSSPTSASTDSGVPAGLVVLSRGI